MIIDLNMKPTLHFEFTTMKVLSCIEFEYDYYEEISKPLSEILLEEIENIEPLNEYADKEDYNLEEIRKVAKILNDLADKIEKTDFTRGKND